MKVDLFCRVESRVIERRKRKKRKRGFVEKMIGEGDFLGVIIRQKMTFTSYILIST